MRALVVGIVILMGAAAGCGDEDEPSVATSPTLSPATTSSEEAPVTSAASGDVTPLVAGAIADLAARAGVAESAITVIENREVTWPDASLGCPEPGMNYLQQLTNGVLVVLEADGQRYEYHGGDTLEYCASPAPPAAGS